MVQSNSHIQENSLAATSKWPTELGKSVRQSAFVVACFGLFATLSMFIYVGRGFQKPRIFNPRVGHVIYGHLHMVKTAGTTLNGEMAARFERVCGHKGYSYDSWQFNERVKRNGEREWSQIPDSIAKAAPRFGRGMVPGWIMDEIGYEDCDYVSQEDSWRFWTTFQSWRIPLELHIPCREPVSHLMSQCNYLRRKFNCANDLENEIRGCLFEMDRFHPNLTTQYSNIQSKCFQAERIQDYIEYMGHKLQEKRFPAEYVFRPTNRPRSKDNECIWSNETALSFTQTYLGRIDYHRYCASCLGTADDLLDNH